MSAPTLIRTRHRNPSALGAQLADRFEAGEALCVSVVDYGPGWYVVGVDRAARKLIVRGANGGELTVPWVDVSE